jgi:hypothetical protein
MEFFTGIHQPADAHRVDRAFVSVARLWDRKGPFPVNEWIMDSGAFKVVERHGGYPAGMSVEEYARRIRRFSTCGTLLAAVAQDYMCEPHMLARTGLTVEDHQRLTVERYDALISCDTGGVYVMPVLQGYAPEDYVRHIRMYGDRLEPGMWVGVGSVCKRNGDPGAIEEVLLAVKAARPDLLLHGFGVKTTALRSRLVRDLLHSADSMAWSFAARAAGRDPNSWREAVRFAESIDRMPVRFYPRQLSLSGFE